MIENSMTKECDDFIGKLTGWNIRIKGLSKIMLRVKLNSLKREKLSGV